MRKSRGLTQAQLAKRLGITPQYLSQMECGKRFFHEWHERRMIHTLKLTPHEADQMIGLCAYQPPEPPKVVADGNPMSPLDFITAMRDKQTKRR
jgi:transcriptional regulator with XRE-family HTH domain